MNLQEQTNRIKEIMGLIVESNGSTINEYPLCVQGFGQPKQNPNSPGTYYIQGTGDYFGYFFYSNSKGVRTGGSQINDIQINGSFDYYCNGNELRFKTIVGVSTGKTISVTEKDTSWDLIKNGTHTIKLGSSGPLVKILQALLIKETGINSGGPKCSENNYLGCDGKFGAGTQKALIEYQKKFSGQGMKPDGIFGKQMYQICQGLGQIKVIGKIMNAVNTVSGAFQSFDKASGISKSITGLGKALKKIGDKNRVPKK